MSCQKYLHNDPFDSGGTKFISGTTCTGSATSYNLGFGGSVCMEAELPLIICDGLTISGSCDSPVLSPTPTPSITPTITPTQLCPELFTFTQTGGPVVNILQGQYERITSYTGGTFLYGYLTGTTKFVQGTAPDGNNYAVYERVEPPYYSNIIYNWSVGSPPTGKVWRAITTTGSSIVNGASFGSISGNVAIASASTYYNNSYVPPLSSTIQDRSWLFNYPVVCPTLTPTPTRTPTPTPTPA